jgi:ABC-type sugar transport system substrate-binding protein
MRKLLALAVLLAPAAALAADAGKEAGMTHTETGYFEVRFPAGWGKTEATFGLSDAEKKVYGAEFSGERAPPRQAPRV